MKKKNLIWGLLLIVIGIIVGINALGIGKIDIFFAGWWTLFIIIPCFIGLFTDEDKSGSLIGIAVGVALLLGCRGIVRFEVLWKLLLPVILILVGLSIIFKDTIGNKVRKEIKKINNKDTQEYGAIFGGQDLDFTKEKFEGCELNAIFGGIKCDIRKAIIKDTVLIKANAIFGGITVYVPSDVNVKISSMPIFGGVADEREDKNYDEKTTVYIDATCMFGGVTICDKRSKDD